MNHNLKQVLFFLFARINKTISVLVSGEKVTLALSNSCELFNAFFFEFSLFTISKFLVHTYYAFLSYINIISLVKFSYEEDIRSPSYRCNSVRTRGIKLELIYIYFPPSSHQIYVCFCPVDLYLKVLISGN